MHRTATQRRRALQLTDAITVITVPAMVAAGYVLGLADEAMVPFGAAARSILLAIGLGLSVGVLANLLLPVTVRRHKLVHLIVLGALVYFGIGSYRFASGDVELPAHDPVALNAPARPPDIYVLVLDAYARQDTLKEEFGFDNDPFLNELEVRGFDVYRDAGTNYTRTALTLTSMLYMKPIADVIRQPATTWNEQYAQLREAMNAAPALAALRELGYRIVAVPPDIESVTMRSADTLMTQGYINEFERHVLRETGLVSLVDAWDNDWILEQHRDRIRAMFRDLAVAHDEPVFVLAHAMSPHVPFAFNPDGSPRPLGDCKPDCWTSTRAYDPASYAAGYVAQIQFVNAQTLEAVDALPEDAVVLVMGDHGSRHGDEPSEWFRTLFAARTPGHPGLFGPAPTPLDRLARVFNTYLGGEIPLLDDGRYSAPSMPLELVPRPDA